jgi:hypothetical protein
MAFEYRIEFKKWVIFIYKHCTYILTYVVEPTNTHVKEYASGTTQH